MKTREEKLIELKGEMDKSTIKVGYFNTNPSVIYSLSRQKTSNDTDNLNTLSINLTYRIFIEHSIDCITVHFYPLKNHSRATSLPHSIGINLNEMWIYIYKCRLIHSQIFVPFNGMNFPIFKKYIN